MATDREPTNINMFNSYYTELILQDSIIKKRGNIKMVAENNTISIEFEKNEICEQLLLLSDVSVNGEQNNLCDNPNFGFKSLIDTIKKINDISLFNIIYVNKDKKYCWNIESSSSSVLKVLFDKLEIYCINKKETDHSKSNLPTIETPKLYVEFGFIKCEVNEFLNMITVK